MFGLLKKKPVEEKYGHANYISDYAHYKATDRHWMLLLSALFVEAKDLEMSGHRARHDLLEIYPEGSLDSDERGEMEDDFVLSSIKKVKKRLKNITELVSSNFEDDVYYAVNCHSEDEVEAAAQEHHEDDEDMLEFYEDIWENRETYQHTLMRIGYIAQSIWQIRLAAYYAVLSEEEAWEYIEKLAVFARPLMTVFSSWEAYLENLKQFHEIYEYDYPEERKYVERAMICLNRREESPLRLVPFDLGVDHSYPYNVTSHSNLFPKRKPSGHHSVRLMIAELLEREDKTQLFEEMDKLSGKTYDQEFRYIYNAAYSLPEEDILELPERYNNVYAYVMRGNYFIDYAWEARGTGTADTVGEENYALFYERLEWALSDLLTAYEMAPMERNVWQSLYWVLALFHSDEANEKKAEIYKLIQEHALDHIGCVYNVSNFKQARWGGSFEENLDWAREVIAGTNKGDATRLIIYGHL